MIVDPLCQFIRTKDPLSEWHRLLVSMLILLTTNEEED